jgi:hypothetical protein
MARSFIVLSGVPSGLLSGLLSGLPSGLLLSAPTPRLLFFHLTPSWNSPILGFIFFPHDDLLLTVLMRAGRFGVHETAPRSFGFGEVGSGGVFIFHSTYNFIITVKLD